MPSYSPVSQPIAVWGEIKPWYRHLTQPSQGREGRDPLILVQGAVGVGAVEVTLVPHIKKALGSIPDSDLFFCGDCTFSCSAWVTSCFSGFIPTIKTDTVIGVSQTLQCITLLKKSVFVAFLWETHWGS